MLTATCPCNQVCINKTLVALPEHRERVQQLCAEVTAFSVGRMADRDSGIQEFSCSADGWEDGVFHFWERYESNVALGRHNTAPEMEAFMRTVREGELRVDWLSCTGRTCTDCRQLAGGS
jgi:quinol monooxygenase YgiN